MNGFHLAVIATCALTCPSAINAQSVIQSELTRTTLASSVDAGGRIVLTATVSTERGAGVPGGTIRFIDDTTLRLLGWADVSRPAIVIDRLSEGQHRFHAAYSGTADFLPVMVQPSQSAILVHNVRATPSISVSSSDDVYASGAVVTLTAVIASGGALTGSVTFRDGERVIVTRVGLDRAGTASFTTSALPDGTHAITADYEGDPGHAPATSAPFRLDVGEHRIRSSQLREGTE